MQVVQGRISYSTLLSAIIILFTGIIPIKIHAAVNLGQIQVSSIGHTFIGISGAGAPAGLPPQTYAVRDALISQRQDLGGGAMVPTVQANFDTNNQFVLTITAPPGQMFLIHPPAGQAVSFYGGITWQGPNVLSNGPSQFSTLAVSFGGLEGVAPDFSTSRTVLSAWHGFFGFNEIVAAGLSNDLAFTSITLTATVPSTNAGSGTLTYTPESDDVFMLSYSTQQTNDPGPIVSLVPINTNGANGTVNLGQIQVSSIGHTFAEIPPLLGPPSYIVRDVLINQYGGGGAMVPSVQANFDTNNRFVLTITAPPGEKFLIHPPAGQPVRFGAGITWQGPYILSNGPSDYGTLAVSFAGQEGVAPDFSASRTDLSAEHGFFGFNDVQSTSFSNDLAFTSITLTATVPSTNVGSGMLTYTPESDDAFTLYYSTQQTNDPGPIVSLVPINTNAAYGTVDLGQIQVSSIGHTFIGSPFGPAGPIPQSYIVRDALISQRQDLGGGAVVPTVQANFDTNNQFVLTITAPPGQEFLIHPPAGQPVRFGAGITWQGPYILSNGPSQFGTLAVSFGSLEGVAPDFSASRTVLSSEHGFFGFNDVESSGFTNDLAFNSITMTATVSSTNAGSGMLTYTPESDDAFVLYYYTQKTNDPGTFVSLVPISKTVIWSNTLTFDEYSLGTSPVTITNGYGGLLWSNFGVYNGALRPTTEGYRTGMISSSNVAFNLYGNPAAISSSNRFNLNSACLTAAFVSGLEVEVQGFVGNTLTYDNTYSLNPTGPSRINFNYLGVTSVKFIASPASQFIMDNLSVSSVPPGAGQPGPLVIASQLNLSLALAPNGDAIVTFTGGVLQSSTDLHGSFTDVPGNPTGTYSVPKANLGVQQFFRVRGN